MYDIRSVKLLDRALGVEFGDGKCIRFEDCWLRDHCRCSNCYHADTYQRAQHILDIPEVEITEFQYDKYSVTVTWEDKHKSVYSAEFLQQFDYKTWSDSRRLKPMLWHGNIADKITRVRVDEFLSSVDVARSVFRSLLDYGVALIEGVEPTVEATEKVCTALGGVQHTIFGGMWEFTTRADHADTAYTNLPLAVHNDNTYFTEAAGLQILHCLEHSNGTGGDTLLIDGFYGANRLKDESPEDFKFLSTFDVEAEYIEEGHHHKYKAPVIKVDDKTKDLVQIRFNVYDRSPMAFANSEECRSYYRSLRSLARYYQDPANQWQFKLKPGIVMAMDNFRVLHGRTGFSGKRRLCGSYVARSDWLDKARALKLIQ
ncbi:trimethyllysine dioxygenase, mitochondrial isoform X2 [Pectinophora gossypiella]|uniref:trimethyllysine dioxygenase, mitochondrial isoform X2 n=1 Tax=Pectinophora gossypiella TaxID=13191 RepID=UPI00214E3B22|nr:trimethyllysine dioxygenase, mitochondrial isoform X2 [Pectinophora gossypiella]